MSNEKHEIAADEYAEFQAFKAQKVKDAKAAKKKENMESYKDLVDAELDKQVPLLKALSSQLHQKKAEVLQGFAGLVEMKREVLERGNKTQQSHTFTNREGTKRITIGHYVTDSYLDTVEDGIAMVHEYLESLANDEQTKSLVAMVLKLLARDASGSLKASRVLQLRKTAEESKNERFIEGVKLIEDAYSPQISKEFVQVFEKLPGESWKAIPLGMTEA